MPRAPRAPHVTPPPRALGARFARSFMLFPNFAGDSSLVFPANERWYRVVGVYALLSIGVPDSSVPTLQLEDGAANILMKFSGGFVQNGNYDVQFASGLTLDQIDDIIIGTMLTQTIPIPPDLLVAPGMRLRLQLQQGDAGSTVNSTCLVFEQL